MGGKSWEQSDLKFFVDWNCEDIINSLSLALSLLCDIHSLVLPNQTNADSYSYTLPQNR